MDEFAVTVTLLVACEADEDHVIDVYYERAIRKLLDAGCKMTYVPAMDGGNSVLKLEPKEANDGEVQVSQV